MARLLVVGLGEVGSALYEIALESGAHEVYGYDVDPSKTACDLGSVPRPIDYLHVCIPFSSWESFYGAVRGYARDFEPRMVIVHSTVAPGTTRRLAAELGVPVAFSPVRGKHPHLKKHMLFWTKWVAAEPPEALSDAAEHLRGLGFKVRPYERAPETLELAKLVETVYRALMIAWWQEVHRAARALGADIEGVAEFVGEVHEVLGDRPVMYPGVIGGHCLMPNTRILRSVYPSKFLDAILESNERRGRELEDPSVREEVERVKKVSLRYVNKEYFGVR